MTTSCLEGHSQGKRATCPLPSKAQEKLGNGQLWAYLKLNMFNQSSCFNWYISTPVICKECQVVDKIHKFVCQLSVKFDAV